MRLPPPEKILGISVLWAAQELARQVKEERRRLDIKSFSGALFKDLESFDALAKGALE